MNKQVYGLGKQEEPIFTTGMGCLLFLSVVAWGGVVIYAYKLSFVGA